MSRKKYEAPRLEVHGNIQQITQTIGNHGKLSDGGAHNMSKTG
ncbi:MAG TPA: lasso peptide [Vicinamibacterales bacterium]|nr:lasso peptide [Vicinamibacterales bacterium]